MKKKRSQYKILRDKCWKLFSLYRRLSYADRYGFVSCVTCDNRYHYKEMNAGHYKHNVLDFDEMNIHPQCVNCNKWNSGRLDRYAEYLIANYGIEEFNQLLIRASMALKGEKYDIEYLRQLAIDLTVKNAELMEKLG